MGGRGYALLIHRYAVPLSRCGSGTLGLFHSPGVKFSPLVPLRYRQEKAKGSGGANMPAPVGEGGSQGLTDEAFFIKTSVRTLRSFLSQRFQIRKLKTEFFQNVRGDGIETIAYAIVGIAQNRDSP